MKDDNSTPQLMWEDTEEPSSMDNVVEDHPNMHTFLLWLYTFFLLMFQTLFRLSDTALNVLLSFFAMFFCSLSRISLVFPQAFLDGLPRNVKAARNLASSNRNSLQHYVCCPSCHFIYEKKKCIVQGENGEMESLRCTYTKFPNHPQLHRRTKCNTLLMKKIKLTSGKISLQPCLVYCYKSVIESLQELISRSTFVEKCELWRKTSTGIEEGLFPDVFNGQIWQDFLSPDGIPFLSVANNYAFQLNVDWFQPFDHTQHSEGAIYMTVMNLPRHERFLSENVILVGVIPGPKEPHMHMNSFLAPLIDELQQLWVGVPMQHHNGIQFMVRAAFCYVWDVTFPQQERFAGLLDIEL